MLFYFITCGGGLQRVCRLRLCMSQGLCGSLNWNWRIGEFGHHRLKSTRSAYLTRSPPRLCHARQFPPLDQPSSTFTQTPSSIVRSDMTPTLFLFALALPSLVAASPHKPHVVTILVDDWGWGNWGRHKDRSQSEQGKPQKAHTIPREQQQRPLLTPPQPPPPPLSAFLEVHTPNVDSLASTGVPLDRHYSYKICSPSRSSLQTGRHPDHVNPYNVGVLVNNDEDPISGFQGIPMNMTGLAEKVRSELRWLQLDRLPTNT